MPAGAFRPSELQCDLACWGGWGWSKVRLALEHTAHTRTITLRHWTMMLALLVFRDRREQWPDPYEYSSRSLYVSVQ